MGKAQFSVPAGYTSEDQDEFSEHDDDWPVGNLSDRIVAGDPDSLAQVVRVLTARMAQRAGQTTDPRSLLFDMSRSVDSLLACFRQIVADLDDLNADDPDARTELASVPIDGLHAAVGSIRSLADNL